MISKHSSQSSLEMEMKTTKVDNIVYLSEYHNDPDIEEIKKRSTKIDDFVRLRMEYLESLEQDDRTAWEIWQDAINPEEK